MSKKKSPALKCCPEDKHDWGMWKTIREGSFGIGIGSIRTCGKCQWREYNDWCSTRTGNSFKIIPPEEVKERL